MVEKVPQVSKLKFGSFEFDPRRHELRQNGFRIKLAASQLRLLTLFFERHGELVTREQITARLWTDTRNIDVSTGINTAINRLRRHLQEAAGAPSAIETVIGLGYRFVPELNIQVIAEPAAAVASDADAFDITVEEAAPYPSHAEPVNGSGSGPQVATEATLPEPPPSGEDMVTAMPAADAAYAAQGTTYDPKSQGVTVAPTTVGGTWLTEALPFVKESAGTRKRASRRIVSGSVLAVCSVALFLAAVPIRARWLAHRAEKSGSASGLQASADRQLLRITLERPIGEMTAAAVSPDGKIVAYADRFGVSVHWFDSGAERLLGVRPAFAVDRLSWLPDQSGLLMSGTATEAHTQQVWAVPLQGAYLQPILQDANRAITSPDGKRIAFTRDGDQEVWEASSDGQGSNRILKAEPGNTVGLLLWSPAGDHLVLTEVSRSTSSNSPAEAPHGITYLCIDADSGKVLDHEAGGPTQSGYMLPDGQLFFVQNDTPGPTTGVANLMAVRTDAKSGRLIGQPKLVQKFNARYAQNLTASLTGARFAAVLDKTETDTFVADLQWPGPSLTEPVQLTKGSRQNFPHSWTADGRGVLLENDSLRTNDVDPRWAIFNVGVNGSPPKLVAKLPGNAAMAQLSPDGRWILFLEFEGRPQRASGIFRVPVEGGPAEQVPTSGNLEEFHCSSSAAGRCVLREAISQDSLVYYALDPVKGMGDELARTPWEPNRLGDWGLSADGALVAAAQHDTLHPGVELIRLKSHGAGVQVLPVQGHGTMLGANWSQDGKTLFVECRTEAGFELVSLDLAGHVRLLRKSLSLIWAVTSRDGKKIAFPGLYQISSVWASDSQPRP